jgi:murein DD-endopeptidase MepM/ murein hydrolase activator NlpD
VNRFRARTALAFLLGVAAGALGLLYLLWRTGGLVPGTLLARRTPDLARSAPLPPLPTIPFPTRGPSPPANAAALTATPALPDPASALEDFTLAGEPLRMPVEGAKTTDFKDDFAEARGGGARRHEAIDIHAPRGTPVVAAVDGRVAKLFNSRQGGLTIYEFDQSAAYAYYYAHLDRYAENLKEGDAVHRGDRLGYVGTTGDAAPDAPHLHFAIYRLGPEKHWWQGLPIDPYPLLLRAR